MSLLHNNRYTKGFTLIELMIVIAIIAILSAIAIPNFISYRNKAFCSKVELEAAQVGTALSDYYGIASHVGLPTIADMHITVDNPVSVQGAVNGRISIIVTDKSSRCPTAYMAASPHWDAATHKFTKFIQ